METNYVSSVKGGWVQSLLQSITSSLRSLKWGDYVFTLALAAGAIFAEIKFSAFMDSYEQIILFCSVPVLAFLGWAWAPLRHLMIGSTALTFMAIYFYLSFLLLSDPVFSF